MKRVSTVPINQIPADVYQLDVESMWGSVSPKAFEDAHSTIGAFEQDEVKVVGEVMSQRFDLQTAGRLVLLGCATGFREMLVLKHAKSLSHERMHLSQIVAIDIAPQFIQRAARRLSMLQAKGFVDNASSHVCSLDTIDLHHFSKPYGGVVALSVYDVQCLLHRDCDCGEPVGLMEYGDKMHEILGSQTSIHPLLYRDHTISEGDALVSYSSEDTRRGGIQYEAIRNLLREYYYGSSDLLGFRIHIAKDRDTLLGLTPNPLFISTWFHFTKLRSLFEERGLQAEEIRTPSAKGSLFLLSSQLKSNDDKKFKCCALALNNVIGNMATPKIMSHFIHSLWRFCSAGGSYGPI